MTAKVKYSISEARLQQMMEEYQEKGGRVVGFDDGSLRTGTVLFLKNGQKLWEFVAYEEYLNEWSSDEIIIKYHNLPKKWLKRLEEYEKVSD
ncbi:MAG: hypothetical protein IJQ84_06180 [Paludibacteraceae bacterium]|nr:hypothetical protein [Paludibacteraceae bacterium]MBR0065442.1 hypothetical protein [Paludibacteraceae bacterium]